jgi:DNA-binding transcriptional regulator YiaG
MARKTQILRAEPVQIPRKVLPKLADRIQEFMRQHRITRSAMAAILQTSEHTLDNWLYEGRSPPACLLSLMDVLENEPAARRRLGVHRARKSVKERGRPFKRGNPYRFGDRRRVDALGVNQSKTALDNADANFYDV